MNFLLKDFRVGVRMLMRHRTFALLSVAALALGIGANAAIFSFVHATVIAPLPFTDPEELVFVAGTVTMDDVELRTSSYPEYTDWKEQSGSFESMSALTRGPASMQADDGSTRVIVSYVEPDYFSVFRVNAVEGTTLAPRHDAPPVGAPAVVISNKLWRERFSADPRVLQRSLEVNGTPLEIVGVLPEGFRGIEGDVDLWAPLHQVAEIIERRAPQDFEARGARFLTVVGRLADEVEVEQAQVELTGIASRLEQQFPESHEGRGVRAIPMDQALLGEVRDGSLVLFAAVGLVWLIACANVVSLLLVRMEERKKEFALRTVVGAPRWRVVRQVISETMILAFAGGAVGLLVAYWGTEVLTALVPVDLPDYVRTGLDLPVFGFLFLFSLLTGTLLGLLPTLRVFRTDLNDSLKGEEEGVTLTAAGGRRPRWQVVLAATQVAVATVVLIGASLMVRSFQQQRAIDPGYDPGSILTFRLQLPGDQYDREQAGTFARNLSPQLRSVPGVESVAMASDLVLDPGYSATFITSQESFEQIPESEQRNTDLYERVYYHRVSPDFFSTLGIPLLRGRGFNERSGTEGFTEVVVSRELAESLWQDRDPIGRHLIVPTNPPFRVVGVVGDVRYRNLIAEPEAIPEDPDVYMPLEWWPPNALGVLLKTGTTPETVVRDVRQRVQGLDPALSLFEVQPLQDRLAEETAVPRLSSTLFGFFGLTALTLAVLGIYGLMAYLVVQRQREIGIRLALGADAGGIQRRFLREGLVITGIGLVVGLLLAVFSGRLLDALLFGLEPLDPPTFAGVAVLLAVVGLIASYLPARRASRIPPLASIRSF